MIWEGVKWNFLFSVYSYIPTRGAEREEKKMFILYSIKSQLETSSSEIQAKVHPNQ